MRHNLMESNKAYLTHGVSKTMVRALMQNFFKFPEECKDLLSSYHLVYWSTSYFKEKINEGTIEKDGISYQIIYKDSFSELSKLGQVKLSFRSAIKEYNLESYVLVMKGN